MRSGILEYVQKKDEGVLLENSAQLMAGEPWIWYAFRWIGRRRAGEKNAAKSKIS
jgi:hypothetical protein